ncbi:MAG: hypothetical protein PW735_06325 [Acidobacteriaceae bacterium]|nr:hypothetical protein [Acidobacteriaceae bacterium]
MAVLLMVGFSFAVAFAFHAVRGMYLHAERLLAKAGRQSARGGVSPILGVEAKLERKGRNVARSAQAEGAEDWGNPLSLRQGSALSQGLVSLFVRVSAQDF